MLVMHDAYDRITLHRVELPKRKERVCFWCGGTNKRGHVYKYWVVKDDDLSGKEIPFGNLYCSADCFSKDYDY